VPIPKPGKKDIRPIVLADVETCIVQRAILDVPQNVETLKPYFINPYSFGGIKRQKNEALAAVPAGVKAVLDAISGGARYVICADISAFFTRISKSSVIDIVAKAVDDDEFTSLLPQAVHVELSNFAQLREHADRFPTEDIGIAQGSALSPLLGNIVLSDFDRQMNGGDCRCIRYIDDFVILGPSEPAVTSRFRMARRLLDALNMAVAIDKTSRNAISINASFEFLGIEFCNGLIRPSAKARAKFLGSLRATFEQSRKALRGYRNGQALPKTQALLGTLKKADGIIQGWGKHYRFCNDQRCFENLDNDVAELVRDYLGFYADERRNTLLDRAPMLGIEMLRGMDVLRSHGLRQTPPVPLSHLLISMPFQGRWAFVSSQAKKAWNACCTSLEAG
jgi:hypothetical protein